MNPYVSSWSSSYVWNYFLNFTFIKSTQGLVDDCWYIWFLLQGFDGKIFFNSVESWAVIAHET